MSRNKKEANGTLFAKMIDAALQSAPELTHFVRDTPRWIKTEVQDLPTEAYLRNIEVLVVPQAVVPGLTACLLRYDVLRTEPEYFLTVSGALVADLSSNTVSDGSAILMESIRDTNPGVFVASVSEGAIAPGIDETNASLAIDLVGHREGEFGISEILPFWTGAIYRIVDERLIRGIVSRPSVESLFRCVALFVVDLELQRSRPGWRSVPNLSPTLGAAYSATLLSDAWHYVAPTILSSLLSYSWTHRYLDIYRCLERLFAVRRVSDWLASMDQQIWSLTGPSRDRFASLVQDELNWKPHEEQALAAIVSKLSPGCRSRLVSSFRQVANWPPAEIPNDLPLAQQVYKLRNAIAHYRGSPQAMPTAADTDQILESLLEAVVDSYTHTASCLADVVPLNSLLPKSPVP